MSSFDAKPYSGKECVIVGGNEEALAIGQALNAVGAILHIVAEEIDEELWWMAIDSGGSALLKDLDENDLPGRSLLVLVDMAETSQTDIDAWTKNSAIDTFYSGVLNRV